MLSRFEAKLEIGYIYPSFGVEINTPFIVGTGFYGFSKRK